MIKHSVVQPSALKYKISDRISELAKPTKSSMGFVDDSENFKVRKSALTGNFTQNVDEMAKPLIRQSMDAGIGSELSKTSQKLSFFEKNPKKPNLTKTPLKSQKLLRRLDLVSE